MEEEEGSASAGKTKGQEAKGQGTVTGHGVSLRAFWGSITVCLSSFSVGYCFRHGMLGWEEIWSQPCWYAGGEGPKRGAWGCAGMKKELGWRARAEERGLGMCWGEEGARMEGQGCRTEQTSWAADISVLSHPSHFFSLHPKAKEDGPAAEERTQLCSQLPNQVLPVSIIN